MGREFNAAVAEAREAVSFAKQQQDDANGVQDRAENALDHIFQGADFAGDRLERDTGMPPRPFRNFTTIAISKAC